MGSPASGTIFYSQSANFQSVDLAPHTALSAQDDWDSTQGGVASAYNRLGGLIGQIADDLLTPIAGVLAVWYVESGAQVFTANRALIRFEVHHFWGLWGKANETTFDQHFQFGGHNGIVGKAFQNHAFRETTDGLFSPVHRNQTTEYRVLGLAMQFAGEELAVKCISIGGPQILCSNYQTLGYPTARSMYDAFQAGERAHVLGFFDFCSHHPAPYIGGLLTCLNQSDWSGFARFYNGNLQIPVYSGKLANAFAAANSVL